MFCSSAFPNDLFTFQTATLSSTAQNVGMVTWADHWATLQGVSPDSRRFLKKHSNSDLESLFCQSSASICINPPLFLLPACAFSSLWSIYKISFLMRLPIIPSWLYVQICFYSLLGLHALSFLLFLRRDKIMNLFSVNTLSPISFKWKTKKNELYCSQWSWH